MKSGIRVLGIDDASFEFDDGETFLTGVVYRGTEFVEDIKTVEVEVDGYDATEKVVELFNRCNNPRQIKCVLIDGISFAGFNIVDIEEVSRKIGKPVIAVTSNRPDRADFQSTMERTGNVDERFKKFSEPAELDLEAGTAYIQHAGIHREDAGKVVKRATLHGLTPEAIRVAHLIGRAFK